MDEIVQKALSKGIELHIAGEFDLASQLYASVIKLQPDHADANHNMGLLKLDTGNDLEALPFLQKALQLDTSIAQFWLSYIKALINLERLDEAGRILDLAKESSIESEEFVQLNQLLNIPTKNAVVAEAEVDIPSQSKPNILDSLKLNQAIRLAEKVTKEGDTEEAKRIYTDILAKFPMNKRAQQRLADLNKPNQPTANQNPPQESINQLLNLYNQGQLVAVVKQAQILTIKYPNAFGVWNILGAAHQGLNDVSSSVTAFKKVTELTPNNAVGFNNLGIALHQIGEMRQAKEACEKAVTLKPDYAEAFFNMGNVLKDQGKLEEAIETYNKALSLKPDYAEAHNNMGVALQEQGKLEDAIEAFNKALLLKPDYAEAFFNMGLAFKGQGKLEDALEAYKKALSMKPAYAQVYNNIGNVLQDQGKMHDALAAYKKALALNPAIAEAYVSMGNVFLVQEKFEDATVAYNKAISIKPDLAQAHNNLGNVLKSQGKLDKAIESYETALSLKPDHSAARAQKLHQQAHICDWSTIEANSLQIGDLIAVDEIVPVFPILSLDDSPKRQLTLAKKNSKTFRELKPLKKFNVQADDTVAKKQLNKDLGADQMLKRIKLGFFSPVFHQNPVSILSARVLELLDQEKFEMFIFAYGKIVNDQYIDRLIKSGAQLIDASELTDKEIAELALEKDIDIAIEFNGFLQNGRLGILAHRPSPIQINYLAYPGTMGSDFYDYIIADEVVIPNENKEYYSENIIHLPNCYMPQDNTRRISKRPVSRTDFGLPENGFVFCCFNNSFKISPREFDIWAMLLDKVNGSVLWLMKSNKWSERNLRNEASKRGVDPNRLVFADKLPLEEHLGRLRLADLFLDTFNFNAHTTASDALWAGVPIVTKIGKSFAARVAGSLLTAIELTELITTTEKEYEELALSLATDSNKFMKIKSKLAEKKNSASLFDTEAYTKNLELAFVHAYQRYKDGLPPAEFKVS